MGKTSCWLLKCKHYDCLWWCSVQSVGFYAMLPCHDLVGWCDEHQYVDAHTKFQYHSLDFLLDNSRSHGINPSNPCWNRWVESYHFNLLCGSCQSEWAFPYYLIGLVIVYLGILVIAIWQAYNLWSTQKWFSGSTYVHIPWHLWLLPASLSGVLSLFIVWKDPQACSLSWFQPLWSLSYAQTCCCWYSCEIIADIGSLCLYFTAGGWCFKTSFRMVWTVLLDACVQLGWPHHSNALASLIPPLDPANDYWELVKT